MNQFLCGYKTGQVRPDNKRKIPGSTPVRRGRIFDVCDLASQEFLFAGSSTDIVQMFKERIGLKGKKHNHNPSVARFVSISKEFQPVWGFSMKEHVFDKENILILFSMVVYLTLFILLSLNMIIK